ncbi:MAG TPA: hypothetical protein VIJ92_09580 [Ginsengibacter sp.]
MKLIKTLWAVTVSVAFASCQKEYSPGDPGTTPTTSNKVKTYTEDVTSGGTHTVTTYDLTYDNANRIVSLISETNPGDKFVFQYGNGSYTGDIYASNALSIHEVFFLNSNSFVDSTFQYNDTNDSTTEKYIYNGAKQLVTLKEYDYSLLTGGGVLSNTTNYKYDSNGNQISAIDDYSETLYDYTALANTLVIGAPYFGVNKNLVKTTTYSFSGTTTVLDHTYTFDASDRLSSEKATDNTGDIFIKTYTYY